ncbi:hypothetical protein C8D88_1011240 [Lentzea atacamensis]|uniref:Uncharacterized protein n=1 Tax=Lentzea atacamensis TaxID=531938 RepID=A0A316IF21_9PSEU|nr:hypothetical protein [Lentzea atacamensis]PWK91206.1 hypothetical protein C8D88_1011240 [Lentzea atacamensis]
MSGYNLLRVSLQCPHCGVESLAEVDFRFGLFEFRDYSVGDRLEWGEEGDRSPRERPEGGNFDGEGYAECAFCKKDFWVTINVRSDVLAEVSVDSSKPGYIR